MSNFTAKSNPKIEKSKFRVENLSEIVLGKNWKFFTQVMNNTLILCTGVANVIFAVRFLNFFLCTLNVESMCNNVGWLHLIAFVLTAPFGLISNIGFFVSSTVLSTLIIITAGLTISSYFVYYSAQNGTATSANMFKIENLGEFFGVVCYAIEGMGLLFPIRASVTDREFFKSIYGSVYGIVVSFYFLLGITGTLAYGQEVSKTEVILLNFGPDMVLIYP